MTTAGRRHNSSGLSTRRNTTRAGGRNIISVPIPIASAYRNTLRGAGHLHRLLCTRACEDHWPWPVDYNGNPLPDAQVSIQFGNFFSEKIAAGMSSRPSYNVPSVPFSGTTINYCCKLHPKMLGQIRVTLIPSG